MPANQLQLEHFRMDFSLLSYYIYIHTLYTKSYVNFKKLFLEKGTRHLFNFLT